jgi:hypothetical protein
MTIFSIAAEAEFLPRSFQTAHELIYLAIESYTKGHRD